MQYHLNEEGRVKDVSVIAGHEAELPEGMTLDNFGEFVYRDGVFVHEPIQQQAEVGVEERLEEIETALMELAELITGVME